MLDYRKADPERDAALFRKRADYLAVCGDFAIDPAAAAVEFGLRQPGVAAVSLNTSVPDRIAVNASYARHKSPAEFWAELKRRKVIDDED
jgi:D-threo-aldose 1-dehydrogenase